MSPPIRKSRRAPYQVGRIAALRYVHPLLWLLPTGLLVTGCAPRQPQELTATVPQTASSDDELVKELDDVLQFTYRDRDLSLSQHAAWQILHGVLAYQRDFLVERDGQLVSAVDHLLDGGPMNGWTVQVVSDQPSGERGLRAILEAGSKTGQGHSDQWLAILAQCDLPVDQPIRVGEETLSMRNYVSQVQWDVPRNVDREYSWTLIGLTHYLPTDATWTASDGKLWSIERLVQIEAEQELAASACGGTHRLIGLTMALQRHRAAGGKLVGSWALANQVTQQAIAAAQQFQNTDGSFSTRYLESPGNSPDLAQNLGTTGHILEFLALALDDQQLREPWVQRAVANLCDLFRMTREVPLECGALYHAAHGLVLYRTRLFGPNRYAVTPPHQGVNRPTGVPDRTGPARPAAAGERSRDLSPTPELVDALRFSPYDGGDEVRDLSAQQSRFPQSHFAGSRGVPIMSFRDSVFR